MKTELDFNFYGKWITVPVEFSYSEMLGGGEVVSDYIRSMSQVIRDRHTETNIRAMDTADIVKFVHELEDQIEKLDDLNKELELSINELEARIAEMEWRPIETAPMDGQRVLSVDKVGRIYSTKYRNGRFKLYGVVWDHEPVSHWMPLPEPPAGDSHE